MNAVLTGAVTVLVDTETMSDDHLDLIKLGHALEGQTVSEEALDRARRVLYAETTHEEAHQELEQKYGHLRSPHEHQEDRRNPRG